MNNRIFLILSLIFSILQGPILPAIFIEGFLVIAIFADQERIRTDKFVALFVAGLLFDLVQDRTLGVTALIFGIAALILHFLGKSGVRNPVFFGLGAFLITLTRGYILWDSLFWLPSIVGAIVTFAYFKYIWRETHLGRII